jgi:group I intron endonuclease
MDICVYKILNRVTGKFYIGYSKSTANRWREHRNSLRRGDHHCSHLQRAWNLYGDLAFEFIRLIECTDIDQARKEEQKMLDQYFESGVMYNSVGSNDLRVVIKHATSKEGALKSAASRRNSIKFKQSAANNIRNANTPEVVAKRVATAMRNGRLGESRRLSIFARNLSDGSLHVYPSIQDAARKLHISAGNIHSSCNGTRGSAGNHIFSYTLREIGYED